jgi:uncharacterized membrane protein
VNRKRIWHATVLAAWAVLFVATIAWWGWLSPEIPAPRALTILLFAGPLLLPLRGLLYDRPSTYLWFNLLLMPYFAAAVAALYAAGGAHPVAALQLAATIVGFTAAFLRTRPTR